MPNPEPGCFVCEKHRGRVELPGGILYEDELVSSSHGIFAEGATETYPGVLFVEPRRHVAGFGELDEAEAARIGVVVNRLAAALRETASAEHVYVAVIGHHVAHLHVWLVPRYPGMPEALWGVELARWPGARKLDRSGIEALCERLRDQLSGFARPT